MTKMLALKRQWRAMLAILAAIFVFVPAAFAMRVTPMVLEIDSRGTSTAARIEVQNLNKGNMPYQVRILHLEFGKDGSITETPADDKFLVFPPQGALPPGGRQVIRLQWVGDAEIAASEAYYVSVEQLPVTLEPGSKEGLDAQVQVLYNMRALLVVAPPGAKPDVSALSARQLNYQPPALPGATDQPPMQDGVEVTLTNAGRRHAMMSNFGWRLEGKDREGKYLRVDVSSDELIQAIGTGYVPALGERSFRLPIPGFGPDPIKMTFIQ
jgi:fimbrial chaperone protein